MAWRGHACWNVTLAYEVRLDMTEAAQPHHAGRSVVGSNVVCKIPPGQLADVFCRPQDGMAQGGVLECRGMQVVKHYLLWYTLHLHAKALIVSRQTLLATYIARCICCSLGQVKLSVDRPGINTRTLLSADPFHFCTQGGVAQSLPQSCSLVCAQGF